MGPDGNFIVRNPSLNPSTSTVSGSVVVPDTVPTGNTDAGGAKNISQLQSALRGFENLKDKDGAYQFGDGSSLQLNPDGKSATLTDEEGKKFKLEFSETGVKITNLQTNQSVNRSGESFFLTAAGGVQVGSVFANARSVSELFNPAARTRAGSDALKDLPDIAANGNPQSVVKAANDVLDTVESDSYDKTKAKGDYSTIGKAMESLGARIDELKKKRGGEGLSAKDAALTEDQIRLLEEARRILNEAQRAAQKMIVTTS
jgi:hypothetical protein